MARYWTSLPDITKNFSRLGIPHQKPGFYDEPAFKAAEHHDPELLNCYARFVYRREYPAAYLEKARQEISFITEKFYEALAAQGTRGACIDASMALSRILEREGYWNVVVCGGVRIKYPDSEGLKDSEFPHVDIGDHQAGHAWIYAPPYRVLDITIRLQDYRGREADHLPPIILAEKPGEAQAEPRDVIARRVLDDMERKRIVTGAMLQRCHRTWKEFTRCFPPSIVVHAGTTLKYVPFRIGASDGPLENITNRTYQGRYPHQVYEEMLPALSALRAAASAATTP